MTAALKVCLIMAGAYLFFFAASIVIGNPVPMFFLSVLCLLLMAIKALELHLIEDSPPMVFGTTKTTTHKTTKKIEVTFKKDIPLVPVRRSDVS